MPKDTLVKVQQGNPNIKLKPGDKVVIIISSIDKESAAMFNLVTANMHLSTGGSSQNQLIGYTVDPDGTIDIPVLGTVQVGGLTRSEVENTVKQMLIDKQLLTSPMVIAEFQNLYFDILGEVVRPGRYSITADKITVLDALGMASDLSIQGLRQTVKVVREEADGRKVYVIDLTSGESVLNSPAYYIQQNDVLYVDCTNFRKRQSVTNGNTTYTPSFWISLASVAITIYNVFK